VGECIGQRRVRWRRDLGLGTVNSPECVKGEKWGKVGGGEIRKYLQDSFGGPSTKKG